MPSSERNVLGNQKSLDTQDSRFRCLPPEQRIAPAKPALEAERQTLTGELHVAYSDTLLA